MRLLVFVFSALVFSSQCAAESQTGVSFEYEGIAHTGPMAIDAVVNDWDGKIIKEDDGFLWQQSSANLFFGPWRVSYLNRFHAEYRFPYQLAEGFYYATNDITPDNEYSRYSRIEARDYRGKGWEVSHAFELTPQLTLTPKISWLLLDRILWGSVEGDVRYGSPDDWGGRLDIDYGYTEDKILRRTLEQEHYGDLYALGLEASFRKGRYTAYYRGENLLGVIDWQGIPYTDARLDTEGNYLLDGYEYYDTVNLTPSAIHWLTQRWQFHGGHQASLELLLTEIQTSAAIKYSRILDNFQLSAGYHPQWRAASLGINSRYAGLEILSDSLDPDSSRSLTISAHITASF